VNRELSYEQSLLALDGLLPKDFQFKFPGALGLKRIASLMHLLGDPQEKLKVIHIAGTSGKTSTATILATLLKDQGFKVGLTISPHLLSIRERIQINNKLITKEHFAAVCTKVMAKITLLSNTPYSGVTYFEALIAMALSYFHEAGVDYAVVETGLGGTFDGTNVITNPDKLSVITRIGLDHTQILGNTLTKIAAQKAGIIKDGNTVLTVKQLPRIMKVFERYSHKAAADMITISRGQNYSSSGKHPKFQFNFNGLILPEIKLHLLGEFQIENTSLALAALQILADKYSFTPDQQRIYATLESISVTGRFSELKYRDHDLILDGAHNPQKMRSFISSLKHLYPDEKFVFMIAFKKNKQYQQCLRMILPLASRIVIAEFFKNNIDTMPKSVSAGSLASLFKKWGFHDFELTHSASKALAAALKNTEKNKIVVTGSLYLISDLLPLLI
jgi:dihydrofolate synthase / folylpolyglutamate synthase